MRLGPFMVIQERARKQGLSLLYWISLKLALFQTKNCDVLSYIMHEVTFTAPLSFHIFVEMYVCMSVCLHVCLSTAWLAVNIFLYLFFLLLARRLTNEPRKEMGQGNSVKVHPVFRVGARTAVGVAIKGSASCCRRRCGRRKTESGPEAES